jgi:hypothetical protein
MHMSYAERIVVHLNVVAFSKDVYRPEGTQNKALCFRACMRTSNAAAAHPAMLALPLGLHQKWPSVPSPPLPIWTQLAPACQVSSFLTTSIMLTESMDMPASGGMEVPRGERRTSSFHRSPPARIPWAPHGDVTAFRPIRKNPRRLPSLESLLPIPPFERDQTRWRFNPPFPHTNNTLSLQMDVDPHSRRLRKTATKKQPVRMLLVEGLQVRHAGIHGLQRPGGRAQLVA